LETRVSSLDKHIFRINGTAAMNVQSDSINTYSGFQIVAHPIIIIVAFSPVIGTCLGKMTTKTMANVAEKNFSSDGKVYPCEIKN